MFTITKQFAFSAAHQLTHLSPTHQCARLHGHNYRVEMVLQSELLDGATGFVRDYGDLKPVRDFIDGELDHRFLNDVQGAGIFTTAEHLALAIFTRFLPSFPELVAVRVSETPNTWAEYRP